MGYVHSINAMLNVALADKINFTWGWE